MTKSDIMITMDSFGDCCPKNWEEIAAWLNDIIEGMDIEDEYGELTLEGREAVDKLWRDYCDGNRGDGAPDPVWD